MCIINEKMQLQMNSSSYSPVILTFLLPLQGFYNVNTQVKSSLEHKWKCGSYWIQTACSTKTADKDRTQHFNQASCRTHCPISCHIVKWTVRYVRCLLHEAARKWQSRKPIHFLKKIMEQANVQIIPQTLYMKLLETLIDCGTSNLSSIDQNPVAV